MVKEFENKNYWALILGGSSGLGLATAKKLAAHGMNICVVHRNSRLQESEITAEFNKIKAEGVGFVSFNTDAINPKKRQELINDLAQYLGKSGQIRTLVHSIAKGNLKPMIAAEEPTLKNDDFILTINAMAISLYDWTKAILQMIPGNELIKAHSLAINPFKRLTLPQDAANVAYLLSKDEASWITGAIIPVDGGAHIS